jgi:hypothetical protein
MYDELGIKLLEYKTYNQKIQENKKKLNLENKSYFQGRKKCYKISPVEILNNRSSKDEYKTEQNKKFRIFTNKLDMINYKTINESEFQTELEINKPNIKANKDLSRLETFFKTPSKNSNFNDLSKEKVLQAGIDVNIPACEKNPRDLITPIDYSNFVSNKSEMIFLD